MAWLVEEETRCNNCFTILQSQIIRWCRKSKGLFQLRNLPFYIFLDKLGMTQASRANLLRSYWLLNYACRCHRIAECSLFAYKIIESDINSKCFFSMSFKAMKLSQWKTQCCIALAKKIFFYLNEIAQESMCCFLAISLPTCRYWISKKGCTAEHAW